MSFASPLWLVGLLPWAAVTFWLLLDRRRLVEVPFIHFWQGLGKAPRAKPTPVKPPIAIVMAIMALLLSVLAAARPMLRSSSGGPAITVIVDRGITMSARGQQRERFKEAVDELSKKLLSAIGSGPLRVRFVPPAPGATLDRTNWVSVVDAMSPSAQKSNDFLAEAIGQSLVDGDENILVISDQPTISDHRIIQIEPLTTASNVTIKNISARALPSPQVMVELRDQSFAPDGQSVKVTLDSDGHSASRIVQLPHGQTSDAFIDLPTLGPVVKVSIDVPDDLPVDNIAWLAREKAGGSIVTSAPLSDPMRKVIAVYRRHRAAGSQSVQIVADLADLPADQPAVVIAPDAVAATNAPLHVESDRLSANVDWNVATTGAHGATPPAGWRTIITRGDAAFVAVRDKPARAVWVCLNSTTWPTHSEYVIFWTNVFDWLGGEEVFSWHPLEGRPQPGVEKSRDGSVHAFNAIDVDFPAIHSNDWSRLQSLKGESVSAGDYTPSACLVALMMMLGCAFAWRRSA